MKRCKYLHMVIVAITAIMAITGCASSTTTSSDMETNNVQQDNIEINDIVETKDNSLIKEIAEPKAEIVLNEYGYTYSIHTNSNSSIKENSDVVLNGKSGVEGTAEESSETILQWDDAQNTLEENRLCWLNNEYLKSNAENISYNVSDNDIVTAKYSMPNSAVEVYVFTVAENDDGNFEFVSNYPTELYDIHQIGEDTTWQCFSYKGYDGTEYTGAVSANENIVCEIKFENCDEQFICDTLAVY